MPSCDLRPFQQNGRWGYTNKDGQIVIKPQFSRAGRFSEGVALVWTGGVPLTEPIVKSFVKMGDVDEKGRWVIESRLKYYFYYDFSEGLVSFRQQSEARHGQCFRYKNGWHTALSASTYLPS
jgi:hypothetical protein